MSLSDPMLWLSIRALKFSITGFLSLPNDVIHIYLGIGVWMVAESIEPGKWKGWGALLPVAFLALGLEVPDVLFNSLVEGRVNWGESLKDILNTSAVPVILAVFRHGPLASAPHSPSSSSGNRGQR